MFSREKPPDPPLLECVSVVRNAPRSSEGHELWEGTQGPLCSPGAVPIPVSVRRARVLCTHRRLCPAGELVICVGWNPPAVPIPRQSCGEVLESLRGSPRDTPIVAAAVVETLRGSFRVDCVALPKGCKSCSQIPRPRKGELVDCLDSTYGSRT